MLTVEERDTAAALRTAAHAVRARLTDNDWGQRRYETARDIVASAAALGPVTDDTVDTAIRAADMLIARLRKETE